MTRPAATENNRAHGRESSGNRVPSHLSNWNKAHRNFAWANSATTDFFSFLSFLTAAAGGNDKNRLDHKAMMMMIIIIIITIFETIPVNDRLTGLPIVKKKKNFLPSWATGKKKKKQKHYQLISMPFENGLHGPWSSVYSFYYFLSMYSNFSWKITIIRSRSTVDY